MAESRSQIAGRLEILVGHRVSEQASRSCVGPDWDNTVSPAHFEEFLSHRADWTSLSIEGLAKALDQRVAGSEPSYVLTFDDGYKDNVEQALPVLERFQCAAIIFVTTGFIGRQTLPPEYALGAVIRDRSVILTPDGREVPCRSLDDKWRTYEALRPGMKRLTSSKRHEYLLELATINGVELVDLHRPYMTWKEVRSLDRHPLITIGAHSKSHAFLPSLSPIQALREIRGSKLELEERLDHIVPCFSYPYGGNNRVTRFLVTLSGFRFAFSTEPCRIDQTSTVERYRIPRLDLKQAILGTRNSDLPES